MKNNTHSPNSPSAIAFAETGSTAVSMGALWAIERKPQSIAPLREWLTRTVIYPDYARKHPPANEAEQQKLMQDANNRSSLLIKGTAMIGAGFVSHLPLQLALEGKFDGPALRSAAFGKGIGITAALGSIMVLNRIAPSAMPALQNAIFPLVKPLLPKDDRGRDSQSAEEIAKLLILDIPSSVVAGLINYAVGQRKAH